MWLTCGVLVGSCQSGEGLEGEECPLCLCSPMEEPVLTPCCHVMCRLCLRDTLRYKQDKSAQGRAKEELSGECPVCRRTISEADLVAITTQQDKEGEGKGEEAMDEGRKEEEGGKVEEEGKEKGAKEEASQGSGKGRPNGGELVLEGSAKMRRLVQELDRYAGLVNKGSLRGISNRLTVDVWMVQAGVQSCGGGGGQGAQGRGVLAVDPHARPRGQGPHTQELGVRTHHSRLL